MMINALDGLHGKRIRFHRTPQAIRSLGQVLPTERSIQAAEAFERALDPFNEALDRIQRAAREREIPSELVQELLDEANRISELGAEHLGRLGDVADEEGLAAWLVEGEAIVDQADAYAARVNQILGPKEAERRRTTLWLLFGGAALVATGAALAIAYGARRRRRKRK